MNNPARKSLKAAGALLAIAVAIALFNYLRFVVIWFPTESVSFSNGDIELAGLLVKPSEEGEFPAVVILHGSGPENLSEPSYRATANTLARGGFAVLLYDKRGVGESGGDFETALYRDFIADAIAAVRYLAGRDDIDARNIGLHANSEGGWFAPEVAVTTRQVAFIFNRVGPPLSWIDNVIWEVRNDLLAAGVAEADLEPLLALTRRRWNYYIDAAADPGLAAGPERDAINVELKRLRTSIPFADQELPEQLVAYDDETYKAIAADFSYDPGPFLEAIDIPMIYTFGENDINVPTDKSVEFLESFREQHDKSIDIVVFEDVGHPMANWTGMFTAGYVPAYLELLSSWTREQVAN